MATETEDSDLKRPNFETNKAEHGPTLDFKIRPDLNNRFKTLAVKEKMHQVVHDHLAGKIYNDDEVEKLITSLADSIKSAVTEEVSARYRVVVSVILGEQRGAGVQVSARCLWDTDTDNYASLTYTTESIFCVATVFGVYYY